MVYVQWYGVAYAYSVACGTGSWYMACGLAYGIRFMVYGLWYMACGMAYGLWYMALTL